jgi:hypothetical protein
MGIRSHVGETVNLSFNQSTTSGPMTVLDSNGVVRPIQPWERLVIDSLEATTLVNAGNAGLLFLADSAATTVPLIVLSATGAAAGGSGASLTVSLPGEGVALQTGSTPYVNTGGYGIAVTVTGTARVTNGKSQGVRANYQCLLTAGGNIGGQ